MSPTYEKMFFIFKMILSGFLIAAISSLAKHFPKWASFITALPIMTFLSVIWIYIETKDLDLLAGYTKDVFIWIIPSMPFFIILIILFQKRVPFVLSLSIASSVLAGVLFMVQKMNWIK